MEFIDERLLNYAEAHSEAESEILKKINRETHLKVLMPRMLSGHLQGQVLATFSKMLQPKRILEIGTYTGYSAICLAQGLTVDGKLITIDINAELENRVRGYFKEAALDEQIDYRIGNAMDIVAQIDETFDLIFIDADKQNYASYYSMVIAKTRKGGFIIADNVLWSGKILQSEAEMDKDTKKMHEFNQMIQADKRVENVLFPIRDGLLVMRKI